MTQFLKRSLSQLQRAVHSQFVSVISMCTLFSTKMRRNLEYLVQWSVYCNEIQPVIS